MALPKTVTTMTYGTCLPSTSELVTFRPFTVKEEKILLMAAEAKDMVSIATAINQVVQACVLSPQLDVTKLAFFDLEHLFLKIRAKSVGEKVTLTYRHGEGKNREGVVCGEATEVEVDLTTIDVPAPPPDEKMVMITETLGVRLKYPTLLQLANLGAAGTGKVPPTKVFDLVAGCIADAFDEETVYTVESQADSLRFVESLPATKVKAIITFFEHMPTAETDVAYTCKKCGQADTVHLKGIQDFF